MDGWMDRQIDKRKQVTFIYSTSSYPVPGTGDVLGEYNVDQAGAESGGTRR